MRNQQKTKILITGRHSTRHAEIQGQPLFSQSPLAQGTAFSLFLRAPYTGSPNNNALQRYLKPRTDTGIRTHIFG